MTILCFFIGTSQGMGLVQTFSKSYSYYPQDIARATGTVVAVGLNSIDINNEYTNRVERFVYLGQDKFQKGDYVRIYYHPKSAVVVMIKRMTVLKYDKKGQNLGNINER
jgi:hypothetical protein